MTDFHLQEVAAPPGWTAAMLKQKLPIEDEVALLLYRDTVAALLERIEPFQQVAPEEVLLLFERLRPGLEAITFRNNARFWLPEFGMGIWLHRDPPTTWTTEEFEAAAPGTLRPVIERVIRIQREPAAQRSAWQMLLGSGALIRVSNSVADAFLTGATELLHPTISDASLTSFPFYLPLIQPDTLMEPSPAYAFMLGDQLPGVDAYLRESVEAEGLFILVRQHPDMFWNNLLQTPLDIDIARITPSTTSTDA